MRYITRQGSLRGHNRGSLKGVGHQGRVVVIYGNFASNLPHLDLAPDISWRDRVHLPLVGNFIRLPHLPRLDLGDPPVPVDHALEGAIDPLRIAVERAGGRAPVWELLV